MTLRHPLGAAANIVAALAVLGGIGQRGGQRRQLDGTWIGQRRGQLGKAVGVEERGVGRAVEECGVPQHVDEKVAVGADAVHAGAGQRVGKQSGGLTAHRGIRDDLRQHRVVEHRHLGTVDDAGVDANAEPVEVPEFGCGVGHFEAVHRAGLRLPALGGVLGVQPGLDRVAARRRWLGVEAAAVGDQQLQRDEVEAGGRLGDRVLDLKPGVHLEEEEVARLVGHELDRARAGVPDGGRREPRRVEQLVPHARSAFDKG